MTSKSNKEGNGTKISLKEYTDIRFDGLEKEIKFMHDASDVAIKLAANDLRARLDAMNEFRAALKDQAATFIPREEFEAKIESHEKGRRDNISLFIALLSMIVAIVSVIIKVK